MMSHKNTSTALKGNVFIDSARQQLWIVNENKSYLPEDYEQIQMDKHMCQKLIILHDSQVQLDRLLPIDIYLLDIDLL